MIETLRILTFNLSSYNCIRSSSSNSIPGFFLVAMGESMQAMKTTPGPGS